MSDKLKRKFQNKCIGFTDEGREYLYGTDWKGYAKALEKEVKELKEWQDSFLLAWNTQDDQRIDQLIKRITIKK